MSGENTSAFSQKLVRRTTTRSYECNVNHGPGSQAGMNKKVRKLVGGLFFFGFAG